MRSYGNASGGGWDHGGKGQRRDNDWSRSGGDWNGNPWTEEKQSMYKKWYDGPPPPVSGSDSRGWNENPVSCIDWQSSNSWQHTPASGSDWQSSNRWQRSQPAVAAAVNTNSPDTVDWSNKKSRIQIGVRKQARTRGTHLTVRRSIHGVLSQQI